MRILRVSEAWSIIKGVRAQTSKVPRGECVSLFVLSGTVSRSWLSVS